jgi:cyclin-dependent kinase 1
LKTPTEEIWPGVSELPDYKVSFPKWNDCTLGAQVGRLSNDLVGMDFLKEMLIYSPGERITAKAALAHEFFEDFDKSGLPPVQDDI